MFAIFGVILAVYRHHGKVSARAVTGDDEVVKVKAVFVGVGDNPLQSLVDLFHVVGEAVFRTETVTDIDGESACARHMLAIAAAHFLSPSIQPPPWILKNTGNFPSVSFPRCFSS